MRPSENLWITVDLSVDNYGQIHRKKNIPKNFEFIHALFHKYSTGKTYFKSIFFVLFTYSHELLSTTIIDPHLLYISLKGKAQESDQWIYTLTDMN